MNITLDLGDTPSVLEALRDPQNAQRIANAAAESYTDDTLDWIAAGRAFVPRTAGGLKQAISWRGLGNGSAEVMANKNYAQYVEEGTGRYAGHQEWDIFPGPGRKALKIPVVTGEGFIFRRKVHHKGSPAFPFFFIDTEAREQHMQERALSVLASRIAHA